MESAECFLIEAQPQNKLLMKKDKKVIKKLFKCLFISHESICTKDKMRYANYYVH